MFTNLAIVWGPHFVGLKQQLCDESFIFLHLVEALGCRARNLQAPSPVGVAATPPAARTKKTSPTLGFIGPLAAGLMRALQRHNDSDGFQGIFMANMERMLWMFSGPIMETMETIKPTTQNSFWTGDQHGMISGGGNIMGCGNFTT